MTILTEGRKEEIDFVLRLYRLHRIGLLGIRKALIETCKICVKLGLDTCDAADNNGCDVRKYLIEITEALYESI